MMYGTIRERSDIRCFIIPEGGTIVADITRYIDKAYEQKEFGDIAELPIDALQGVSSADADAIQKALGIKSIRQLAENKYVRAAQAITFFAAAR